MQWIEKGKTYTYSTVTVNSKGHLYVAQNSNGTLFATNININSGGNFYMGHWDVGTPRGIVNTTNMIVNSGGGVNIGAPTYNNKGKGKLIISNSLQNNGTINVHILIDEDSFRCGGLSGSGVINFSRLAGQALIITGGSSGTYSGTFTGNKFDIVINSGANQTLNCSTSNIRNLSTAGNTSIADSATITMACDSVSITGGILYLGKHSNSQFTCSGTIEQTGGTFYIGGYSGCSCSNTKSCATAAAMNVNSYSTVRIGGSGCYPAGSLKVTGALTNNGTINIYRLTETDAFSCGSLYGAGVINCAAAGTRNSIYIQGNARGNFKGTIKDCDTLNCGGIIWHGFSSTNIDVQKFESWGYIVIGDHADGKIDCTSVTTNNATNLSLGENATGTLNCTGNIDHSRGYIRLGYWNDGGPNSGIGNIITSSMAIGNTADLTIGARSSSGQKGSLKVTRTLTNNGIINIYRLTEYDAFSCGTLAGSGQIYFYNIGKKLTITGGNSGTYSGAFTGSGFDLVINSGASQTLNCSTSNIVRITTAGTTHIGNSGTGTITCNSVLINGGALYVGEHATGRLTCSGTINQTAGNFYIGHCGCTSGKGYVTANEMDVGSGLTVTLGNTGNNSSGSLKVTGTLTNDGTINIYRLTDFYSFSCRQLLGSGTLCINSPYVSTVISEMVDGSKIGILNLFTTLCLGYNNKTAYLDITAVDVKSPSGKFAIGDASGTGYLKAGTINNSGLLHLAFTANSSGNVEAKNITSSGTIRIGNGVNGSGKGELIVSGKLTNNGQMYLDSLKTSESFKCTNLSGTGNLEVNTTAKLNTISGSTLGILNVNADFYIGYAASGYLNTTSGYLNTNSINVASGGALYIGNGGKGKIRVSNTLTVHGLVRVDGVVDAEPLVFNKLTGNGTLTISPLDSSSVYLTLTNDSDIGTLNVNRSFGIKYTQKVTFQVGNVNMSSANTKFLIGEHGQLTLKCLGTINQSNAFFHIGEGTRGNCATDSVNVSCNTYNISSGGGLVMGTVGGIRGKLIVDGTLTNNGIITINYLLDENSFSCNKILGKGVLNIHNENCAVCMNISQGSTVGTLDLKNNLNFGYSGSSYLTADIVKVYNSGILNIGRYGNSITKGSITSTSMSVELGSAVNIGYSGYGLGELIVNGTITNNGIINVYNLIGLNSFSFFCNKLEGTTGNLSIKAPVSLNTLNESYTKKLEISSSLSLGNGGAGYLKAGSIDVNSPGVLYIGNSGGGYVTVENNMKIAVNSKVSIGNKASSSALGSLSIISELENSGTIIINKLTDSSAFAVKKITGNGNMEVYTTDKTTYLNTVEGSTLNNLKIEGLLTIGKTNGSGYITVQSVTMLSGALCLGTSLRNIGKLICKGNFAQTLGKILLYEGELETKSATLNGILEIGMIGNTGSGKFFVDESFTNNGIVTLNRPFDNSSFKVGSLNGHGKIDFVKSSTLEITGKSEGTFTGDFLKDGNVLVSGQAIQNFNRGSSGSHVKKFTNIGKARIGGGTEGILDCESLDINGGEFIVGNKATGKLIFTDSINHSGGLFKIGCGSSGNGNVSGKNLNINKGMILEIGDEFGGEGALIVYDTIENKGTINIRKVSGMGSFTFVKLLGKGGVNLYNNSCYVNFSCENNIEIGNLLVSGAKVKIGADSKASCVECNSVNIEGTASDVIIGDFVSGTLRCSGLINQTAGKVNIATSSSSSVGLIDAVNYTLQGGTINVGTGLGKGKMIVSNKLTNNAIIEVADGLILSCGCLVGTGDIKGKNSLILIKNGNESGEAAVYDGTISATGTSTKITKEGAGTQYFNGQNTYEGSTVVDSGILAGHISYAANLTINGVGKYLFATKTKTDLNKTLTGKLTGDGVLDLSKGCLTFGTSSAFQGKIVNTNTDIAKSVMVISPNVQMDFGSSEHEVKGTIELASSSSPSPINTITGKFLNCYLKSGSIGSGIYAKSPVTFKGIYDNGCTHLTGNNDLTIDYGFSNDDFRVATMVYSWSKNGAWLNNTSVVPKFTGAIIKCGAGRQIFAYRGEPSEKPGHTKETNIKGGTLAGLLSPNAELYIAQNAKYQISVYEGTNNRTGIVEQTIKGLRGEGTVDFSGDSGFKADIIIDVDSGKTLDFKGQFSGKGNVIKSGAGIQKLSNPNTQIESEIIVRGTGSLEVMGLENEGIRLEDSSSYKMLTGQKTTYLESTSAATNAKFNLNGEVLTIQGGKGDERIFYGKVVDDTFVSSINIVSKASQKFNTQNLTQVKSLSVSDSNFSLGYKGVGFLKTGVIEIKDSGTMSVGDSASGRGNLTGQTLAITSGGTLNIGYYDSTQTNGSVSISDCSVTNGAINLGLGSGKGEFKVTNLLEMNRSTLTCNTLINQTQSFTVGLLCGDGDSNLILGNKSNLYVTGQNIINSDFSKVFAGGITGTGDLYIKNTGNANYQVLDTKEYSTLGNLNVLSGLLVLGGSLESYLNCKSVTVSSGKTYLGHTKDSNLAVSEEFTLTAGSVYCGYGSVSTVTCKNYTQNAGYLYMGYGANAEFICNGLLHFAGGELKIGGETAGNGNLETQDMKIDNARTLYVGVAGKTTGQIKITNLLENNGIMEINNLYDENSFCVGSLKGNSTGAINLKNQNILKIKGTGELYSGKITGGKIRLVEGSQRFSGVINSDSATLTSENFGLEGSASFSLSSTLQADLSNLKIDGASYISCKSLFVNNSNITWASTKESKITDAISVSGESSFDSNLKLNTPINLNTGAKLALLGSTTVSSAISGNGDVISKGNVVFESAGNTYVGKTKIEKGASLSGVPSNQSFLEVYGQFFNNANISVVGLTGDGSITQSDGFEININNKANTEFAGTFENGYYLSKGGANSQKISGVLKIKTLEIKEGSLIVGETSRFEPESTLLNGSATLQLWNKELKTNLSVDSENSLLDIKENVKISGLASLNKKLNINNNDKELVLEGILRGTNSKIVKTGTGALKLGEIRADDSSLLVQVIEGNVGVSSKAMLGENMSFHLAPETILKLDSHQTFSSIQGEGTVDLNGYSLALKSKKPGSLTISNKIISEGNCKNSLSVFGDMKFSESSLLGFCGCIKASEDSLVEILGETNAKFSLYASDNSRIKLNSSKEITKISGSGIIEISGAPDAYLTVKNDTEQTFFGDFLNTKLIIDSDKTFRWDGAEKSHDNGVYLTGEANFVVEPGVKLNTKEKFDLSGEKTSLWFESSQEISSLTGSGTVYLSKNDLKIMIDEDTEFTGDIIGEGTIMLSAKTKDTKFTWSGQNGKAKSFGGRIITDENVNFVLDAAINKEAEIPYNSGSLINLVRDEKRTEEQLNGDLNLNGKTLSVSVSKDFDYSGLIKGKGQINITGKEKLLNYALFSRLVGEENITINLEKISLIMDRFCELKNSVINVGASSSLVMCSTTNLTDGALVRFNQENTKIDAPNDLICSADLEINENISIQNSNTFTQKGEFRGQGNVTKFGAGKFIMSADSEKSPRTFLVREGTISGLFNVGTNIELQNSAVFELSENWAVNQLNSSADTTKIILNGNKLTTRGDSSYKGIFDKNSGGIIVVNKFTICGESRNCGSIEVAKDAELLLQESSQTMSVTGEGSVIIGNNNLTLIGDENKEFSGVIIGSGDIIKDCENQYILSGNYENHSGSLLINNGEIKLETTARLGRGDIILNPNAVLEIACEENINGNVCLYGGQIATDRDAEINHVIYTDNGQINALNGDLTLNKSIVKREADESLGQILKYGQHSLNINGTYQDDIIFNVYEGALNVHAELTQNSGIDLINSGSACYLFKDQNIACFSGVGTMDLNSKKLTVLKESTFSGSIVGEGELTFSGNKEFIFSGNIETFSGVVSVEKDTRLVMQEGASFNKNVAINLKENSLINVYSRQEISGLNGAGQFNLNGNDLCISMSKDSVLVGKIIGAQKLILENKEGEEHTLKLQCERFEAPVEVKQNICLSFQEDVILDDVTLEKGSNISFKRGAEIKKLSGSGVITTNDLVLNLCDDSDFSGDIICRGKITVNGGHKLSLGQIEGLEEKSFAGEFLLNNSTLAIEDGVLINENTEFKLSKESAVEFYSDQTLNSISGYGTIKFDGLLTIQNVNSGTFFGAIETTNAASTLMFDSLQQFVLDGIDKNINGTVKLIKLTKLLSKSNITLEKLILLNQESTMECNAELSFKKFEGEGKIIQHDLIKITLDDSRDIDFYGNISGEKEILVSGDGQLTLNKDLSHRGKLSLRDGAKAVLKSKLNDGQILDIGKDSSLMLEKDQTIYSMVGEGTFDCNMNPVDFILRKDMLFLGDIINANSLNLSGNSEFNCANILAKGTQINTVSLKESAKMFVNGTLSETTDIATETRDCIVNLGKEQTIKSVLGNGCFELKAFKLTLKGDAEHIEKPFNGSFNSGTLELRGYDMLYGDHETKPLIGSIRILENSWFKVAQKTYINPLEKFFIDETSKVSFLEQTVISSLEGEGKLEIFDKNFGIDGDNETNFFGQIIGTGNLILNGKSDKKMVLGGDNRELTGNIILDGRCLELSEKCLLNEKTSMVLQNANLIISNENIKNVISVQQNAKIAPNKAISLYNKINMQTQSVLEIDTNSHNVDYLGVITGFAKIVKSGMGALNISGKSSNCNGILDIKSGTVSFLKDTEFGANLVVEIASGAKFETASDIFLNKLIGVGLFEQSALNKLVVNMNESFDCCIGINNGTLEIKTPLTNKSLKMRLSSNSNLQNILINKNTELEVAEGTILGGDASLAVKGKLNVIPENYEIKNIVCEGGIINANNLSLIGEGLESVFDGEVKAKQIDTQCLVTKFVKAVSAERLNVLRGCFESLDAVNNIDHIEIGQNSTFIGFGGIKEIEWIGGVKPQGRASNLADQFGVLSIKNANIQEHSTLNTVISRLKCNSVKISESVGGLSNLEIVVDCAINELLKIKSRQFTIMTLPEGVDDDILPSFSRTKGLGKIICNDNILIERNRLNLVLKIGDFEIKEEYKNAIDTDAGAMLSDLEK